MTNNALDPRPERQVDDLSLRRTGDNRTLWIVLGLVAVVAIVAVVFLFSQNNAGTQQASLDRAAAQQQAIDNTNQAGAAANSAALSASQAANSATDSATRSADSAARAAQAPKPPAGDDSSASSPAPAQPQ